MPKDGGGVLVAWHPNGLVDPALILATCPRPVTFGARDGLFRIPGLGSVMRAIGVVPIQRPQDRPDADPEARKAANAASLQRLVDRVQGGSFACLFPEGTSHDAPHLLELKTGAARLFLQARASGGPPPVLLPVGLHYDAKRRFRSRVLVEFHPPIQLPPPAEGDPGVALTRTLDAVLREVVRATESWELHLLMRRARKLVRAERAARAGADPGRPDIEEMALGFARVWTGYYARKQTHPELVEALLGRVREYDADLRALRMEDHELDRPAPVLRPSIILALALQALGVFLVLPPLVLLGLLVHGPPLAALALFSRVVARYRKDEATLKLLVGLLLLPLTWATVGVGAFLAWEPLRASFPSLPAQAAPGVALVVALSVLGGALALRYWRLARETARAVRVRLTRARQRVAIAHLRVERAWLCDRLLEVADGVALPGRVAADGRIRR